MADNATYYYGTGRRKNAIARVRLYPGEGTILVNNKPSLQYFGRRMLEMVVVEPLKLTESAKRFNISAMVARDHRCVFPGCDRPAPWCDGHHLVHWADGGPTRLDNLGLVCRTHHRKVHEEGWKLRREKDGRWIATPPALIVTSRSRSG